MDFNETLRRIARTPKGEIVDADKPVVNSPKDSYNDGKGATHKPPQPAKRRR